MSSPLTLPSIPFRPDSRIIKVKRTQFFGKGEQPDDFEGLASDSFIAWVTQLGLTTGASPIRLASSSVANQTATINATDLSGGALGSGLYALAYYMQVTTPASVSSSLQVTFDWTYNGVAQSETFTALTTNLTTSHQSGGLPLIHADASTPIRYTVTYASVGTAMAYAFDVTLTKVEG